MGLSLEEVENQAAGVVRELLKTCMVHVLTEAEYDERLEGHCFKIHLHGLDHMVIIQTDDPR